MEELKYNNGINVKRNWYRKIQEINILIGTSYKKGGIGSVTQDRLHEDITYQLYHNYLNNETYIKLFKKAKMVFINYERHTDKDRFYKMREQIFIINNKLYFESSKTFKRIKLLNSLGI